MSEVALTVPVLRHDAAVEKKVKAVPSAHEKKHKVTTTIKTEKHAKTDPKRVPRSTFEDQTRHYFDPLSLTLAPDTRLDPDNTQYNQVTGSFQPNDRSQLALVPDAPIISNDITSAGIENMGKGNNHTVVVPLFTLLNSLSPGPAPQ
ncbi:MAG: hypothetical protein ACREFC_07930 [Stellaceae bacterium]